MGNYFSVPLFGRHGNDTLPVFTYGVHRFTTSTSLGNITALTVVE